MAGGCCSSKAEADRSIAQTPSSIQNDKPTVSDSDCQLKEREAAGGQVPAFLGP